MTVSKALPSGGEVVEVDDQKHDSRVVIEVTSSEKPAESQDTTSPVSSSSNGMEDYPHGAALLLLTLGLMLVVLMVAVDNYILSTAVPAITSTFQSLSDVGWYGSSYYLTQMAFQPAVGKLFKQFDIKPVFSASIVVFELGSIICAAAVSSPMFIIGRLIAGLGGAGLYVGAVVMIGHAVPTVKLPFYVSIVTSMYGVSSLLAPILGGIFTDSPRLTWRFCFWINPPMGLLAFIVMTLVYKSPRQARSEKSMLGKFLDLDLGGSVLLVAGFVCLLLALQWGGIQYAWKSAQVVGTLVGFVVIIAVFLALQTWQDEQQASIPVRLFRHRTIVFGFLYTVFLNLAITSAVYWIPLYYQAALGVSALDSGIRTLPFVTPLLCTPLITGFLIMKIGYYVPFTWACGAMATAGMGLLTVLTVQTPSSYVIGSLVLAGFGSGFGRQVPLSAFQHLLPREDIPLASMLFSFAIALGGVLATCLSNSLFANAFNSRLIAAGVPDSLKVVTGGATDLSQRVPEGLLSVAEAACAGAIADTFVLSTVFAGLCFLCSTCLKWANLKH